MDPSIRPAHYGLCFVCRDRMDHSAIGVTSLDWQHRNKRLAWLCLPCGERLLEFMYGMALRGAS